jgi:DNA-binding NtrC family response regulator
MTKRLSKRKLTVFKSYSGEEALETLKENSQIDLVILDVKMPGMDGVETLKQIKQRFPLVEVIMLTGHATAASAVEGMKLGATDYLTKPTSVEELIAKAEEAFNKRIVLEQKIQMAEALKKSQI